MLIRLAMVVILTLSQTSYAGCPDEVQPLSKGQIANCDGLLFSPEASKKADEAIQDSKYYKELTQKLYERQDLTTKEINILDQRLQLYVKQSQVLSEELAKRETQSEWQKYIYFGLGLLTMGVAVHEASKLDR